MVDSVPRRALVLYIGVSYSATAPSLTLSSSDLSSGRMISTGIVSWRILGSGSSRLYSERFQRAPSRNNPYKAIEYMICIRSSNLVFLQKSMNTYKVKTNIISAGSSTEKLLDWKQSAPSLSEVVFLCLN